MQPIRFKDLPDVLYVSDVARFLRLSERAVRHYIDKGVIRHRKLGGRIIIPKSALEAFVMEDTAHGSAINS